MNNKKPAFIFSVYQDNLLDIDNLANHNETLKSLIYHGITFKPVVLLNKGKKGLGYYVESNAAYNGHELFDYVNTLVVKYSQDDFLSINESREARLISPKGYSELLGQFVCVEENQAKELGSYIYCPTTKYYFIWE